MLRRITQISTCASDPDHLADVYALCNDGTLFVNTKGRGWAEVEPIPQDPSLDAAVKMRNEYHAMQNKLCIAEDMINEVASYQGALMGSSNRNAALYHERINIGTKLAEILKLNDVGGE